MTAFPIHPVSEVSLPRAQLLTLKEYAHLVRIHEVTAKRHAIAGKIPGAVKVGGQWRIPEPRITS